MWPGTASIERENIVVTKMDQAQCRRNQIVEKEDVPELEIQDPGDRLCFHRPGQVPGHDLVTDDCSCNAESGRTEFTILQQKTMLTSMRSESIKQISQTAEASSGEGGPINTAKR